MFAQSIQRRFSRWLNNTRIQERKLYAPLIRQALSQWKAARLILALDTSLLWNRYCLIRVSLYYRGRAIPVMWKVIPHKSSSVAHSSYSKLLYAVATVLPQGVEVLFLADRGFADIALQGATAAAQVALSHSEQVQFLSLSRQAWTSDFELSVAPRQKRSFSMPWR